ncbi:MAG TPA: ATP-binding protein [Vicinamibacterales bacterium]|nr:ATP-binding protein [Vicinamibacterales bacterium]
MPLTVRDAVRDARGAGAMLYVASVIAAGGALFVARVPRAYPDVRLVAALLLTGAVLSMFKLRLPLADSVSTMSMGYAVEVAALLMAGVNVAMLVAVVAVLVQCTLRVRRRQPLYRAVFSAASIVLTVQAAGWVWSALGGRVAETGFAMIVALSAAATTYFIVNTLLVALAIALTAGANPRRVWDREFFWSAPGYFLSTAVGALAALVLMSQTYLLLPLVAAPLYISYRAYEVSVRRINEERRHARELGAMMETTQAALARATRSEAALALEKERLAMETTRLSVTLRTISDGVITVDGTGLVIVMNDGAEELTGLAGSDLTGQPVARMFESLGVSKALSEPAIERVLQVGAPAHLRSDVESAGRTRLVEVTGTPTRDGDGQVSGAVWVVRDVSDAAQLEHEREKTARLESLGVLAGGLAHDFNNLLMGIVGNLSLAQGLVPPSDGTLASRLREAEAACVRARGVTSQLLTFAKGGAPVKAATSIRELVVECARFALSGSPVAAEFTIAPDVWSAQVDTVQVGQVVHNLVLNAMQAMPRGGVVRVSLANDELRSDSRDPRVPLMAGKYVRLTVEDHGPGIPADRLGRIFDPYFTTKKKGSGLGLAISYSIVRAHGGAIVVESEPGSGARFSVYLPACDAVVEAVCAPARMRVPAVRGGRVLLMDDDAAVAGVAQEMLEALGYDVTLASCGRDAIERFHAAEACGEPFDAVILDLTVPGGMGGGDAVAYIKGLRADVPVLVTSGYADDSVLSRYGEHGFDGVLPKPFALAELGQALDAAREACFVRRAADLVSGCPGHSGRIPDGRGSAGRSLPG